MTISPSVMPVDTSAVRHSELAIIKSWSACVTGQHVTANSTNGSCPPHVEQIGIQRHAVMRDPAG
jgi:hypothetical protein